MTKFNKKIKIYLFKNTQMVDVSILVTEDILGMTKFNSKFSKQYFKFYEGAEKAIKKFAEDVRRKKYPKKNQCY